MYIQTRPKSKSPLIPSNPLQSPWSGEELNNALKRTFFTYHTTDERVQRDSAIDHPVILIGEFTLRCMHRMAQRKKKIYAPNRLVG
jgi:hypothetical protein